MADDFLDDTNDNQEENFADLLESFDSEMTEDLKVGDKVNGKIIHIGDENVFVDTGTKVDGAIARAELLDKDGELTSKVGDTLELYVVSAGESEIILSRSISGSADVGILLTALETSTPVDGKVSEVCKGGFSIEVAGKRAFCPISQIDVKYVENPESYVGETFLFLIKRVEEGGRNIVVSRRDYLNIGIEKARAEFFENNQPESIVSGTVTKLMPYGAFVEVAPGVEGMVHISEISWSRLEKAEDGLAPGDVIQVKILSISKSDDLKSAKISLSVKQAGMDPWELVGERFHVGDSLPGKVTRLAPFGAFVELAPGTEGLVHVSEMSYTKRVLRPEDVVSSGDTVDVLIKEIDLEKKRISLSMKDAAGDPWATVDSKYKPGQSVSGTLEKKEGFGYFINLEPGITALLPKSKINQAENQAAIENTKIGDTLKLIVENVNKEERKISLTAAGSETKNSDWKNFSGGQSSSMGSLGDLLQQAMKNKK